jgi:dihydroxy-acid dehydratase
VSPASIRNALRVLLAIGGSSNALIHLTAIAGRLGIPIDPRQLNQISDDTPTLVALKPTGSHYMEDFHASGGVPALLHRLRDSLELDAMTVTGQTLGQLLDAPAPWSDPHVVHPVDDPDLDVAPDDFLVLRNAGPVATGMPEAGYLPIPAKLAARGVRDMVRLSDARMSGTAYGTIVLHITPEAAIGGPLALVRDGDRISLSVRTARLDLLVDENELQRRRAALPTEETRRSEYGYRKLFRDHVLQADHGCDFDYCVPAPNADLAEDVPTNLVARSDRTGPARR